MKQSDLEAKREAAAYTSDVGTSLEDSESSGYETGHEFDADDVLAQRIHEDEDGTDILQYLVKYTDYPLHECKWEPRSKLSKDLFEKWKTKRKGLGPQEVVEFSSRYEQEHTKAVEKARTAQQSRRQKRKKLRDEAERRKEAAREEALHREQATLNNSPVASKMVPPTRDRPTSTGNTDEKGFSRRRRRPIVTRSDDDTSAAPSDEASSSSSDSEPLSFRQRNRARAQQERSEDEASSKMPSRPSSPQQRRKSLVEASSSITGANAEATPSAIVGNKTSMPTIMPSSNRGQTDVKDSGGIKIVNEPKNPQRKPWDTHGKHFRTLHFRGLAEKRSRIEGTPDINELDFVNGTPAGIPSKTGSTTPHTARHNPYERREPGRRRVLEDDQDDDPGPRFTGIPLRSYEEGKIPMSCFEWKHGNSCPHGAERCRFLHREHGQDGNLLQVTTWKGKIPPKYWDPPETCWFWLRDGNCKKPAEQCIYAHRNTGHLPFGDGKAIPIDPRIQPGSTAAREITGGGKDPDVVFSMTAKQVSNNSDHFGFTHRNTAKTEDTIGAGNDPNPKSTQTKPKLRYPPQTCYFWLRGRTGCDFSAEDCNFAHENTGWLPNFQQDIVPIDPNEKPIFHATPLRHHYVPPTSQRFIPTHLQTCFFWNEYNCKKPEGKCQRLHRYTGAVADPPPRWVPPPGWQPKSHLRDEPLPPQTQQATTRQNMEPLSMEIDELTSTDHDGPTPMDEDEPVAKSRFEPTLPDSELERDSSLPSRPTKQLLGDSLLLSPQSIDRTLPATNLTVEPLDVARKIEIAFRLDLDDMFRCNGDQYADKIAQPNAFLLYDPQKHIEELELIPRWLCMYHVKVFSPQEMGLGGAWDAFKQLVLEGGSGIIIASPDFDGYSCLPGFGEVLRGTVRLWSVGDQPRADHSIWNPKASADTHFDRLEIFPHGGVIYITDDVFEKKPQLALQIVEHFFAKIAAGRKVESDVIPGTYINDGILLWRLGARPELMKWIGDICMNHQTEIEEGDPDYVSLEKLYVLLHDNGYCEPDGTFERPANSRRLDFFPIISASQALAEDIGLYFNARKRSQYEANTDMAHHYSGLVVVERRNYRHYFIVHTAPDEVDWKDTITNIDEIMTPEKCIEYFSQEPKGSKFDNYEWAYPEKQADSLAGWLMDGQDGNV